MSKERHRIKIDRKTDSEVSKQQGVAPPDAEVPKQ